MKLKIALSLVLLISFSAVAEDTVNDFSFNKTESRWFMQLGMQNGGDSTKPLPIYNRANRQLYIYENSLTVGTPWQGQAFDAWALDDAKAGGFWKFEFGRETAISDMLTLSTALGYQIDSIEGDLTDGSGGEGFFGMRRFTFDTIAFYNHNQHRFGFGAAYHFNIEFTHKEFGSNFKLQSDYQFDDAIGAIFQYDYLVNEDVSIGFRITRISYDLTELSVRNKVGSSVDSFSIACGAECEEIINADSFGIHLTMRF